MSRASTAASCFATSLVIHFGSFSRKGPSARPSLLNVIRWRSQQNFLSGWLSGIGKRLSQYRQRRRLMGLSVSRMGEGVLYRGMATAIIHSTV